MISSFRGVFAQLLECCDLAKGHYVGGGAVHPSGTWVLRLGAMLCSHTALCSNCQRVYSSLHDGKVSKIRIRRNFICNVPFKTRDPRCLTEYNTMQYREIKQNPSFQERINIEFHYVSTIETFLFSFVFNVHFVGEEHDGGSSSSGHNMETVIVMIVVVQPLFVWLPDEVHLFKYDHMVFAARVWHSVFVPRLPAVPAFEAKMWGRF